MPDQRPPINPHQDELTDLETSLKNKARVTRWIAVAIMAAFAGAAVWFGGKLISFGPPKPTPVETLLTGQFIELQLSWFETLTTGSRINKNLQADRARSFKEAADEFVAEAENVDSTLAASFRTLTDVMGKHDQVTFLIEDGNKELREASAAVNEALSTLSPRLVVDVEPFEGLLNDNYVTASMLFVYEVLETWRFDWGDGSGEPVELKVVRRRDTLSTEAYLHGYVRRQDASAAYVLQDNATSFVARSIFPSFKNPGIIFEKQFGRRVPEFMNEPYRVLLELVQLELKSAAGADDELFNKTAELVSRRERIYQRVEEKAEKMGIRIRKPDGLLWPRSFTHEVLKHQTETKKQGEQLMVDRDEDDLIAIAAELDSDEHERVLEAVAGLITRSVTFHEARHVLDVRQGLEPGDCVLDRVRITDDDMDFLRSVEMESRAFLTEVIEAPEAMRLTLLQLANHLYYRNWTVYFYTARTVLQPLAFTEEEKDSLPSGWDYLEELTLRLASLDKEVLRNRARKLYGECFGEYVGLQPRPPEKPAGGGCSVAW